MNLRELCTKNTTLNSSDITKLEQVEAVLPLIAELTNADIFIDCINDDCKTAFVAAQAKPDKLESVYEDSVVGVDALREKEPAVYQAVERGIPARDLKAITQEGISVKQDVVPIRGKSGQIIGVLIREKDISSTLRRDKKYDIMAKERDAMERKDLHISGDLDTANDDSVNMREVHHRVKNSLQMIASIMNLQVRHSDNPEIKMAFKENVQRVLSIAAIHEILTGGESPNGVQLQVLLERICLNIRVISGGNKMVNIVVTGDELLVSADTSTSVAIVVNELVSNALEHGYTEKQSGEIIVDINVGSLYTTITVEDDGCGYNMASSKTKDSLGLALVNLTVKDKLHGTFRTFSDSNGTKAFFSFKM